MSICNQLDSFSSGFAFGLLTSSNRFLGCQGNFAMPYTPYTPAFNIFNTVSYGMPYSSVYSPVFSPFVPSFGAFGMSYGTSIFSPYYMSFNPFEQYTPGISSSWFFNSISEPQVGLYSENSEPFNYEKQMSTLPMTANSSSENVSGNALADSFDRMWSSYAANSKYMTNSIGSVKKTDYKPQVTSSNPESVRNRSASGKLWTSMTDKEMQQVYGNYDFDVTKPYSGTAENLNKFLNKYAGNDLKGKGSVFLKAQETYGINALALIAICGQETSYGTKGNGKNGTHNVANIEKPKGASYSGRWKRYTSVDDCIMDLARLLKNNYVTSPGNGKVEHLTKLYQINSKYCPGAETSSNTNWAKGVSNCIASIQNKIGNNVA